MAWAISSYLLLIMIREKKHDVQQFVERIFLSETRRLPLWLLGEFRLLNEFFFVDGWHGWLFSFTFLLKIREFLTLETVQHSWRGTGMSF